MILSMETGPLQTEEVEVPQPALEKEPQKSRYERRFRQNGRSESCEFYTASVSQAVIKLARITPLQYYA